MAEGLQAPRPLLGKAYYCSDIPIFVREQPETVLGHLAAHHPHDLEPAQRLAWQAQIEMLQRELRTLEQGWIAFEFAIPRMGKRADIVILLAGIVFVLEFKVGAEAFGSAAIEQVMDYALDLKNFHTGSHARPIVPVVIATDAVTRPGQLTLFPDDIAQPVLISGRGLVQTLWQMAAQYPGQPALDPKSWMASGYKPTPTIIEAAQALYGAHGVEEITRSDAGARNLGITNVRLVEIIEQAKQDRRKTICFVTGVPGAGKTLAGLNLVTQRTRAHEDEHAVFLSGNGPLVDVLREALARDEHARLGGPIGEARRKVKSFIQNIHHFRDYYLQRDDAPIEGVVVFDEAQRAWNRRKIGRFMREKHGLQDFGQSEPEFLISVMDRHKDWCVIVCLVGGGQEINDGEAGLTEWFDAIKARFHDWRIHVSDQLNQPVYNWGRDLAKELSRLEFHVQADLHLSVSIRSFRAETLSDFVNEVVAGRMQSAKALFDTLAANYPLVLTRDLQAARSWLRCKARGSERFGLVASSGAQRLKPDGLNVRQKIDAPHWFLDSRIDVRSSFYLEDPATEFDIQGLELDWVCVCWDADFRRTAGRWNCHSFQGSRWNNVRDAIQQTYLANAYRVLMTRARQGMIIYVPPGVADDPTRLPEFYDGVAEYLSQCGIGYLTSPAATEGVLPDTLLS
ncbi:MAG: hypothetical protein BGN85_13300 [Alphaproteobacteria bacterium 64-11]|nr:DUF2075 domain-containing protein [Alphaproteobacteria bacterium]OJU12908.1 MAG: hypothetical protein BGN85_13300 [Alphaproteobacteria bacterium 64-11]